MSLGCPPSSTPGPGSAANSVAHSTCSDDPGGQDSASQGGGQEAACDEDEAVALDPPELNRRLQQLRLLHAVYRDKPPADLADMIKRRRGAS